MSNAGRPPSGHLGSADFDCAELYGVDPSIAPGLPRPMGWRVRLPDGTGAWDKVGVLDTDWALVGAGGGSGFPGYGSAPPAVQTAGAAGASALASRSDHTHAGVAQVTTTDTWIGTATAAAIATLTQNIVARWTIGAPRFYAVSGASGSDANVGFSDTSRADAGTKALLTLERLAEIVPKVGNGRTLVIAVERGTYTGSIGAVLNSLAGYVAIGVVATGTLASAGAVAFAGDANDIKGTGAITATGMNAAGYNPTAGATTTVIPCQLAGGGAPAFPAEPAIPLGCRMRFDSATATAALRNVSRFVSKVTSSQLEVGSIFPAVPAVGDVFYLEQPGVICPGLSIVGGGWDSNSGVQVAGFDFSTNVALNGGRFRPSFCRWRGGLSTGHAGYVFMDQFYNDPVSPQTVGGHRAEGAMSGSSYGAIWVIDATYAPSLDVRNSPSLTVDLGSVFGFVQLSGCRGGTRLADFGASTSNNRACRIISSGNSAPFNTGAALNIDNCSLVFGAVEVGGQTTGDAIALSGINDLIFASTPGLTGATGVATKVGLNLQNASLAARCLGSRIVVPTAQTVSGAAGEIRDGAGNILTWASVLASGYVDACGNAFIGGTGGGPLGRICLTGVVVGSAGGAVFSYVDGQAFGLPPTPVNQTERQRRTISQMIAARLRVCVVAGGAGNNCTVTLYRNGVATAMTITVAAGDPVGTKYLDAAHPVQFADNDDWDLRIDDPLAEPETPTMYLSATLEYFI